MRKKKGVQFITLGDRRKTRYSTEDGQALYYQRQGHIWRIVHFDPSMPVDKQYSNVGPQYRSEKELLQDLHRYAIEAWGM